MSLKYIFFKRLVRSRFPKLFQVADHKNNVFFTCWPQLCCGPFYIRFSEYIAIFSQVLHALNQTQFPRTNWKILADHLWSADMSLGTTALDKWLALQTKYNLSPNSWPFFCSWDFFCRIYQVFAFVWKWPDKFGKFCILFQIWLYFFGHRL